ncbi:hypothetical protein [Actinomadura sp. 7K507]|uniref:hypothetical protein n=1 Tax=Actinomadura sp. 7K507 TaxID=2530365 RepID=UPI001A9D0762|nr:hypothetical protein [Actinomadura sp. 7K507]
MTDARPLGDDGAALIAAARSDDTARFAVMRERYRRELQVHCHRTLANYEDAQDMTQETFRPDGALDRLLGDTIAFAPRVTGSRKTV